MALPLPASALPPTLLDGMILAASWLIAVWFKPWQVLAHRPLQSPWLATVVILPWLWWMQKLLPSGMALHLSGACLLVLMFGWPMAVMMGLPISMIALLIDLFGPQEFARVASATTQVSPGWHEAASLMWQHQKALVAQAVWSNVVPATLALLLGLSIRRLLPRHLFVYILGRGFIVTALAITATGGLRLLLGDLPTGLDRTEWMLGHWLLGWGEAISTGMLVAVFVAFKPDWLLTYSDERYLPGNSEE